MTTAQSLDSSQDESVSSEGPTAFQNHEDVTAHDNRLWVKLRTKVFGNMESLENHLDRVARGFFPVGYTVFITVYFVMFLVVLWIPFTKYVWYIFTSMMQLVVKAQG